MLVTAKAIETADIHGKDISANRQRLLNALKRLNHSELAVPGLSGNIHFDENGGAVGTLAMSIYRHGRLIPAYTQYCYLPQASAMPQASPSSAPKLINIDGRTLIRKQIVFVGLDMIDMRNFRFSSLSADLDFYLWFRFKEYFDPISIRFPTATEPDCLKRPVLSSRFNDTDLLTFRVRTCFYDVFRLDTYPIGPETLSFPVVQQIGGINAPILIPDPFPSDKKARRQTPASSEDDWRVGEVFFSPDNGFGMHKPTLSDNGLVQFHANFPIERHNYGMAFRLFPPLGLLALLTFAAYTLRPEYLGGRLLIVVSAAALTIFHQHYFLSNLQKAACLQKVYGTLYLFDAVTVLFSVGAYGLMRHNRPTAAGRLNRIGKVTHVAVGIAALSVLVYLFAGFR